MNKPSTDENRQELIDDISYYLRNAPDDYKKSKSGGFRTIYFVYDTSINYYLFFSSFYPKSKNYFI